MNRDEHDQLWELLGKARTPKERPFFASKVMRTVSEGSQAGPLTGHLSMWAWLRAKWLAPVAVTACAVLAVIITMQPPVQRVMPETGQANSEPNIDDVIEDSIDQLLAAEDHSVWLSADQSSFLP